VEAYAPQLLVVDFRGAGGGGGCESPETHGLRRDREEDPNDSTLVRYARLASYVGVWVLFSGVLVLYNK
jgi:hypothetical protein